MARQDRIEPQPGQESVWDYPRPPRLEPVEERLRIIFDGITVADTLGGYRVLETSHPPVFYIPPADVRVDLLEPAPGQSLCEFKGVARYWTLRHGTRASERAAWSYPDPTATFMAIKDALAFYASKVDACYVGEERVTPQEGDFYGGWVTSRVVGPFKGGPGTWGW